ncbi:MAG: discoidin domain-containing protein, partial [Acidobacteriota bacterium]|nr:discoidin domain-containing protein [Acidobacteriota bacterium]
QPSKCSRVICGLVCATLSLQPIAVPYPRGTQVLLDATVTVDFTPGHPVHRFIPSHALGAGVDGHSIGETDRQLSPANIKAMLSAGLKPLTYRLRTELAGEAWHWNPKGSWSDPAHQQGYWTSSSKVDRPIHNCYGYRLPRRGNTIDQANDDGYSRIDDGDVKTFWKSNPYLDKHFTGGDSTMPQWVMIDLGERKLINAIRIFWANPFATNYSIEYGEFVGEEDLSQRLPTEWRPFPQGNVVKGTGGSAALRLSTEPLSARYVRIVLNESSGKGPHNSEDIRDRIGYVIREIYLGTLDSRNGFHDAIDHGTGRYKQTDIYVSSTDPWHRAIDRDEQTEQPGFDFIFKTGLTNGLPLLVPVPVLYDTPENAAAEISYLQNRHYAVERIEMGEEPDGQFVNPEHYGALYLQFEKAIHKINPALQLGGPSLQDIEQSQVPGRIEFGKAGWMARFLDYLKRRGQLDKFTFFSFEWYPFPDDCRPEQLAEGTQMLTDALNELQQGGLTHDIPWVITEFGYSAFGARAEVDLDGALLDVDSVARFLTMGGEAAYLYGYEASEVIKEQECSSGNNMLFFRDDRGHIKTPTATYWGSRLLTQEWIQPGDQTHEIYPASSDVRNGNGDELITAYALLRPDGLWSLLLINRDPKNGYQVKVRFQNALGKSGSTLAGPVGLFQFSRAQYQLNSDPKNPYPIKAEAPEHHVVNGPVQSIALSPYSLTVVRARLGS